MSPRRWFVAFALIAASALPASVYADDTKPETPRAAPSEVPSEAVAPIPPQRLGWLPIHHVERMKLQAEHPRLAGRLHALSRQGEKQVARMRDAKLDAGARAKIRKQLRRNAQEAGRLVQKLQASAELRGMSSEVLRAVAEAPGGPRAKLLHAMRLGPQILELPTETLACLTRVLDHVQGAITLAHVRIESLRKRARTKDPEAKAFANQARQELERTIREIERRYWTLTDAVVDRAQRAVWFRSLPPEWLDKANALEHLFALPGLTPSQAQQIQSIFTELEAEVSPDQAAVRRLQAERKKKGTPGKRRKALQREIQQAQQRVATLHVAAAKRVRELLSESQEEAYYAIPPRRSANDRKQRLERLLQDFPFTPPQQVQLANLRKDYAGQVREIQGRLRAIQAQAAAYGEESPQMMGMMSQMAGVQGDGARLSREALGRVFLEVMTPEQLSAWILCQGGRVR